MKSIPRILHYVWLGDKELLPASYKVLMEHTRNLHPDWDIKIWYDEDILPIINQSELNRHDTKMYQADLARYEIMALEGGVYLDWDFYIYKKLDSLIENNDNFVSLESRDVPVNSIMGFSENHWFAWNLVREARKSSRIEKHRLMGGARNSLWAVGARFFSTQVLKHEKHLNLIPRPCFVPYSYSHFRLNRWDGKGVPGGYGIHLWNSNSTPVIFNDFVRGLPESKGYEKELDDEANKIRDWDHVRTENIKRHIANDEVEKIIDHGLL